MPTFNFHRTITLPKNRKVGVKLEASLTQGAAPHSEERIKAQAKRIRAQARRIEKLEQRVETQTQRTTALTQQIERIRTMLASNDLEEALAEAGIKLDQLMEIETETQNATAQAQKQIERIRTMLVANDLEGALAEASRNLAAWEDGKAMEVAFWQEYLATKGLAWPEDYEPRLDPEQPLQDHVIKHLSAPPGATVSILDVGAGPLTKLGKRWEGRTVRITAVDPLAVRYKQLLAAAGISPPVETEPGEVERLTERFPTDQFDLVNMENALDHCYDPLLGIRQMLEVVRPGGFVLLTHHVNEAHRTGYTGFHQWNLCADNGHFVVWNRQARISVNDALDDIAEVSLEIWGEDLESSRGPYGGSIPYEGEIFVALRKKS